MTHDWMKVQLELNKGFQEQITMLNELINIQVEVNRRLEERVKELENFNKKIQEEAN